MLSRDIIWIFYGLLNITERNTAEIETYSKKKKYSHFIPQEKHTKFLKPFITIRKVNFTKKKGNKEGPQHNSFLLN